MNDDSRSGVQEEAAASVRNLLSTSIGVALAASIVPITQAATITVTSNGDSGTGTLRQAVINAAAGDTINFQSGLTSPITLTSGQIAITKALAITGPGAGALTISGANSSRIFYVHPASVQAVTISGVTLANGHVTTGPGGAVYSKGANFSLQDSVVQSNSSITPTGTKGGGGVFAIGTGVTLTISGSTIDSNTSNGGGGGVYLSSGTGGQSIVTSSIISGNTSTSGWGGGLYTTGDTSQVSQTSVINNQTQLDPGGGIQPCSTAFTISDSLVSGNTSASDGGGLYVCYGSLTMTRTTVIGNTSASNGGGLGLYNATGASTIQDSTISGNTASGGNGGGLEVRAPTGTAGNDYAVTMTNSTIVHNSSSGSGGGVYSNLGYIKGSPTGTAALTIESSTIANNTTGTGGGILAATNGAAIVLHNSIVAKNTATTIDPDTSGTFTANFNFIFAPGDATLNGGNNTAGTDPQLGSFGDYGGSTATKLPKSGSPVINAGDNTGAPSADQRGLPRPIGSTVDIGADERQASEDTIFLDGLEGY
jgi:hypothetical protein